VSTQETNLTDKEKSATSKYGLTPKQVRLVDTIVATGCSIKEASIKAGYSTKDGGRVQASRTLRTPKVQRYMMDQCARTLGLGAVVASNKLVHLAGSAKSEYVQLEASRDVLDRVGLRTPDKVQHSVEGQLKINIDLG
jgi:phage terminase small subunit